MSESPAFYERLPDPVSRLHCALGGFIVASRRLIEALRDAKELLDSGNRPLRLDWPGQDAERSAFAERHGNSGDPVPSPTRWQHLLAEIEVAWADWWREGEASLDSVPKVAEWIDDESIPAEDRRTSKIVDVLHGTREPFLELKPKVTDHCEGCESVGALRSILRYVERWGPPPWTSPLAELQRVLRDFAKLQGKAAVADAPDKASNLPPRVVNAVSLYNEGCNALKSTNDKPTDREVYDLLIGTYARADKPSPLPTFGSWTSYLRQWRRATGKQKRSPRKGRATGRSVVNDADV